MDRSRWLAFGIAALVLLLDRLTKAVIEISVSAWETYVVIPNFFNIVHSENRGAAFGLLADASAEWRSFVLVGLSLVVMVFVGSLLWQSARPGGGSRSLRTGLALMLGGALGNLYDRLAEGSVTDFLQFYLGSYEWPAFNVADSAITIGAGLLLVDLVRHRRQPVRT
jgi:signal peptidase II